MSTIILWIKYEVHNIYANAVSFHKLSTLINLKDPDIIVGTLINFNFVYWFLATGICVDI